MDVNCEGDCPEAVVMSPIRVVEQDLPSFSVFDERVVKYCKNLFD